MLDNYENCLGSERLETHANMLIIQQFRDSHDSNIPDEYVKILPMCPVPQST